MTFTIPVRTTNPLNGSGGTTMGARMAASAVRGRQRDVTRLAWGVAWALTPRQERPGLPCVVTLTRIAPSSGLDDDALPASMKSIRDELAVLLGLPPRKVRGHRAHAEDRDPRVRWVYAQRRGKPREYAVEVEVRAATDALGIVEAREGRGGK